MWRKSSDANTADPRLLRSHQTESGALSEACRDMQDSFLTMIGCGTGRGLRKTDDYISKAKRGKWRDFFFSFKIGAKMVRWK